jgi:hypothetical protein
MTKNYTITMYSNTVNYTKYTKVPKLYKCMF